MSVLRSFKVLEGWILVECTVEAHVWRYSGIASLLKRQVDGQTRCLAAEAPTEPEFAKARTTSLDSFKLVRLLLVRGSSPSLGRDVWHCDCEAEGDRVAKKGASSEATATTSVKK